MGHKVYIGREDDLWLKKKKIRMFARDDASSSFVSCQPMCEWQSANRPTEQ